MMYAVIISVLLLMVLSMLRVNVLISILLAALSAGLIGGLSTIETMNMLISGMGGQAETALSVILLGIFAVMIKYSGITGILVKKLLKFMKGKRGVILLVIAGISSFSQNLVPVHIAFIPILIPPLLQLFDRMKIDRRVKRRTKNAKAFHDKCENAYLGCWVWANIGFITTERVTKQ
ncbi:hypothetical protein ACO1D1_24830, partial [Neobacillus sp. 19]